MINGVLVEMKVKDALPPLKTNTDGLKNVEKELKEQLLAKQKELDDWKVRRTRNLIFTLPLLQKRRLTEHLRLYRRRTMSRSCNKAFLWRGRR